MTLLSCILVGLIVGMALIMIHLIGEKQAAEKYAQFHKDGSNYWFIEAKTYHNAAIKQSIENEILKGKRCPECESELACGCGEKPAGKSGAW